QIFLRVTESHTLWQLPKWRPGRYELQNYHRNISDVQATSQSGNPLAIHRASTHSWQLEAEAGQEVIISYKYYANNKDAGGSYVDPEMVYVNGINLFLYTETSLQQACELAVDIAPEWILAGIPSHISQGEKMCFENFHSLVDTPFFAAEKLIHHHFPVGECQYHLWFLGDCKPDLGRMENDFTSYIKAQVNVFESIPTKEFHFLTLSRTDTFRHGVEHPHSTVLSLGPGHLLMQESEYDSFLEICSHELFHVWNVKSIRPADMLPYRYHEENYSKLHYVTEGITTYYGDLMLWKAKVYSLKKWMKLVNESLQRHYLMGGKDTVSLEMASFNSWVNGYSQEGFPNRRISFYTKGSLVAMLLDIELRRASKDQVSLDDVMYHMYQQHGQLKDGYTKASLLALIEEVSGENMEAFFEDYISGTQSLNPALQQMATYLGFRYAEVSPGNLAVSILGLKHSYNTEGSATVTHVLPHALPEGASLHKGDILIAVNGTKINRNFPELLSFYSKDIWQIHYFREGKLKMMEVKVKETSFHIPQLFTDASRTPEQQERIRAWRRSRSQVFPI
ncbi:MAG: hypothetical protein AAF388_25380, partial [Bacteroidota bacterium]